MALLKKWLIPSISVLMGAIMPVIGYVFDMNLIFDLVGWVPIIAVLSWLCWGEKYELINLWTFFATLLSLQVCWIILSNGTHDNNLELWGIIAGSFFYATILLFLVLRFIFKIKLFSSKKEMFFSIILIPIIACVVSAITMGIYQLNLEYLLLIVMIVIWISWTLLYS